MLADSCVRCVTTTRIPNIHQLWHSVEYDHATTELQREFSSVIGLAPRGIRPLPLAQLSKDIGDGGNKLARTLVRFGFGLQDIGTNTDDIVQPLATFIGTLRARRSNLSKSVDELLELEVKIDAELHPIEFAFVTQGHPAPIRRRLIRKLEQLAARIQETLERLYREEREEQSRSNHS